MVLPILIRSTEEGFRAVANEYRLGAAALGFSRTTTLFQLLLPAAVPGLVVGLVLGIGRAIAETAALIFTSGYVDRMPESWYSSMDCRTLVAQENIGRMKPTDLMGANVSSGINEPLIQTENLKNAIRAKNRVC